jgi:type II secretory pathway component PulF
MIHQNVTLKSTERLNLLSNLSTMITAGIPILESIDSLLEDSKGNTQKILQIMKEDILQGNHLYASFAKFPNVFDKVTVNVLKASEEAGTMDETLKDLYLQIEREMQFKDKIKGALIYPVVIVFVFLGVILMMLVVVIPKISTVFSKLNVKLPLPTKIMIIASNVLLEYTIPIIAGFIVAGVFIFFIYKAQKHRILDMVYSLPAVRTLVKNIDLAHWSRSMYLLLTSGITITNAMELSGETVLRKDIAKALKHANDTVLSGKNLSQGLKDNRKLFSGIVIKIIEAGEKTGTLDKSMADVSKQMDYQVDNSLRNLTALMEPVMLVAVGILVGGMMLSIIAPIYGMIGQVGVR